MRYSVNKRRSAAKFNKGHRRTKAANHMITRGGWRL